MTFEYIIQHKTEYDGDERFDRHHLIDTDTGRSWGYIDGPTATQLFFYVMPEGYCQNRAYLALDTAKAYLESTVYKLDLEDAQEMDKTYGKRSRAKR